jgi:uncharacterized delta-60 repeat protein
MRRSSAWFALSLLFASAARAGLPVDGFVDSGFGTDGLARVDPTDAGLPGSTGVRDFVRAATSGRFYVLGSGGGLALARLQPDGALDTGFGSQGFATVLPALPDAQTTILSRVAVASSGKPMVVGQFTELEGGIADGQGIVCRFNVAGNPDATFDGEGCRVIELDLGGPRTGDTVSAIAPLAGDALLVAGSASTISNGTTTRGFVAKLTAAGAFDTGFGLGGLRYLDFPATDRVGVEEIAVAQDGRIYVAGNRRSGAVETAFVAAFDPGGNPLASFGTGGIAQVSFASEFPAPADIRHSVTGLVTDANGDVTLCGYARNFSPTQLLVTLARFDAAGALDAGFDGDGRLITAFNEIDSINLTGPCVLDRRGRLTLALHFGASTGFDPSLALMRFLDDGRTDEDFHGAGRVTLTLDLGPGGAGSELVGGLVAQGEDLVVAATASFADIADDDNGPFELVAMRIKNDALFRGGFEDAE